MNHDGPRRTKAWLKEKETDLEHGHDDIHIVLCAGFAQASDLPLEQLVIVVRALILRLPV